MITNQVEAIRIDDFGLGFATKISQLGYPPNLSPYCLNVTSKIIKALTKRNGYTLSGTAVSIPDTYGLIEWSNVSGTTNRIIATAGVNLKYSDNLGTAWTTPTLPSPLSLAELYDFTFVTSGANTYLLMTSSARDTMLQMTSAGIVSSVSGAPLAKVVTNWENYTFAGNLSDGASDVKYSALGDHTTWPTANREYLSTKYGDEVRGFEILKRRLYIFKDWTIYRYSFLGGTPVFQSDPLHGIGTISPKTIKEIDIPEIGKVLIFLGTNGKVYIFDGYNPPQDVSDIVSYDNKSKVNLGRLNFTSMNKAVGINYPDLKWYILFLPITSTNTVALVFDYNRKPISIWPFDNHHVSAIANCTNSAGKKKPFFVDYNGNLFEFDKGNTDNGVAINAYWRSPRYESGSSQLLKQGSQIALVTESKGSYSLTFKYRLNWDTDWITADNVKQYNIDDAFLGESFILGQSKLGGHEAVENIIDMPSAANLAQFEIGDNTINRPFTVYKLEPLQQKLGVGGS